MRIVRFAVKNTVGFGILEKELIKGLQTDPFLAPVTPPAALALDGKTYPLKAVKLLPPCLPSKLVCLGLNYKLHADETGLKLPENPLLFLKPSTAVIGPEDNIVFPANYTRVDYEGELGVVIGKKAKNVPAEKFKEYILGYTCVNDVTERDNQKADGQWTRGKGYDTFAPIGPWIETEMDPADILVETYLNGEKKQSGRTKDLIFHIPKLISFISGVMTLLPGDVIATGTPEGIGPMKLGDTVEIRIEKIGSLINHTLVQK